MKASSFGVQILAFAFGLVALPLAERTASAADESFRFEFQSVSSPRTAHPSGWFTCEISGFKSTGNGPLVPVTLGIVDYEFGTALCGGQVLPGTTFDFSPGGPPPVGSEASLGGTVWIDHNGDVVWSFEK